MLEIKWIVLGVSVLGVGLFIWLAFRNARLRGRHEERADDAENELDFVKDVKKRRDKLGDDDERKRLRRKHTR